MSALLSALTGVSTGARAPQATVAVAQTVAAEAAARAAEKAVSGRPAVTPAQPVDVAQVGEASPFRLAPTAPLYLSRRRE